MQSEETCDLLATRKRLAGVERRTAPEQLECWVTNGCLADVTPVHAKSLVDAWLERRAKLETPSNIEVVDDLMCEMRGVVVGGVRAWRTKEDVTDS